MNLEGRFLPYQIQFTELFKGLSPLLGPSEKSVTGLLNCHASFIAMIYNYEGKSHDQ